jgi:hypothetical protein
MDSSWLLFSMTYSSLRVPIGLMIIFLAWQICEKREEILISEDVWVNRPATWHMT